MVADRSVPRNWVASIGPTGVFTLGPSEWLAPGYWEAFFDGDADAVAAFQEGCDKASEAP
jgi:hypothetical protein